MNVIIIMMIHSLCKPCFFSDNEKLFSGREFIVIFWHIIIIFLSFVAHSQFSGFFWQFRQAGRLDSIMLTYEHRPFNKM